MSRNRVARPRVPAVVKRGGPHAVKTKVLHRKRKHKGQNR